MRGWLSTLARSASQFDPDTQTTPTLRTPVRWVIVWERAHAASRQGERLTDPLSSSLVNRGCPDGEFELQPALADGKIVALGHAGSVPASVLLPQAIATEVLLPVKPYRTIDLARAAGVHPNTVRLYERIGFISPVPRARNGYRVFAEKHLCQIRICRCVFDHSYLGRRLRAASLELIGAVQAWNLPLARRFAQKYLALVQHELAVARQTADILQRWANGTPPARGGRTQSRREMATQIGVTEEVLRNWERNGLLRVPRTGAQPHARLRQHRTGAPSRHPHAPAVRVQHNRDLQQPAPI